MKNPNHGNNEISILCVEDDPTSRLILSQIITTKFPIHKVYVAENGNGGLKLFREFRSDIVLTDISMPVMDGMLMAAEIRVLSPATHIIAMSGDSEPECLSEGVGTLFDGHLLKPIVQKDLVGAIGECIERIAIKNGFEF